jgi:hypothetical protein
MLKLKSFYVLGRLMAGVGARAAMFLAIHNQQIEPVLLAAVPPGQQRLSTLSLFEVF